MKKSFFASFVFISALLIFSCQKSDGQFEISGRVLDYADGKPLKTTVSVFGDDINSAKQQTEGSIFFAKTETHDDGTFTLVASRYSRGLYTIQIGSTRLERRRFDSEKKQNLGDFYSGKHTAYCRLTMTSVSDSSARLAKNDTNTFYTIQQRG